MRATASTLHPTGLLARALASFVALKTVWERRRLVGQMASLDDHMLRDIGLTRFDIDSVLSDPAMTDPTWRLALRAREARSNQRAAVLERRQWANLLGTPDDAPPAKSDRRAA